MPDINLHEQISRWVDAHREEFLRDTARLVAVKSVREDPAPGAPFGPGPRQALEEAMALCGEYGFETAVYADCVGVASFGPQPAAVDLLCHLDVVGEGDLADWNSDPYQMTLGEDDCAYGRGTIDDKGPAVAALYALRCLRDLSLPLRSGARLILGTDEESGMDDLPRYYALCQAAPNTFSPDANFPVYNTEKGHYQPVFTAAFEKTELRPAVLSFRGGHRTNVLPAEATALIAGLTAEEVERAAASLSPALELRCEVAEEPEGVRLSVRGRDAHASLPDDGVNGITGLLRILNSLPLAPCGSTNYIRALNDLFPHGDNHGRALGIQMQDALSGDLTLAFSLFSMDETGLRGQFDARVPLCADEANCKTVVEQALGRFGFTVTGEMLPPHHTPGDGAFVRTLLASYEAFTGQKGECLSMGGGTYVHHIEGGVAFGPAMPGFEGNMHGANEHMNISDMLCAIKIYAAAVAEICTAEQA